MLRKTITLLLLLALLVAALPAAAQADNLLKDPSFEGENYSQIGVDPADPFTTYNAPWFWWGGFAVGGDAPWKNVYPSGFPHTGPVKRSGNRSYNMARGGGTFTAWLLQQVSVQPNSDVQGGAWAYIQNNVAGAVTRVGIDPTGGTDPNSPAVVWSPFAGGLYQWNLMQVTARAGASGVVTLFLYATQSQPSDPNGVFWDDAYLVGIPGAGLTTTQPGSAPVAPPTRVASSTVRVNVRAGAGTSFPRIGTLNPGDAYAVTGEANGWYSLDFNGQTGWVSGAFVTVGEGQPTATGGVPAAAPTVSSLNFTVDYTLRLRAAPNTASETLARIPFNTVVQAIGRTADSQWLQVTANGQTGWIAARYGRADGAISGLPVTG
ncbi:MAG: SH3 domain-containing protein [Chloroflexi bacterium]|nr:SH3 domain-containing protein [Chloroflexota bacterium]